MNGRNSSGLALRLGTLCELLRPVGENRRRWLTPVFVILGALGLLLSALEAIPIVAPFIYAVL